MKLLNRSALILLLCTLGGCSYFSNGGVMSAQDQNYLTARSIPPLRIPPGISTASFESDYPVSEKSFPVKQLQVDLTPPGLQS